jgi:hypothetical protein
VRCNAITKGGDRCKLEATTGSYCWSHAPETAELRRQRGQRGGKARGAGELAEIKRAIREVIEGVQDGRTERGVGAVAFQGFNALLKAIELERKVREQEVLEQRIEELERELA